MMPFKRPFFKKNGLFKMPVVSSKATFSTTKSERVCKMISTSSCYVD